HAFPELNKKEHIERAHNIIAETHKIALGASHHREVLEIIWQNVLASLLRNDFHWQHMYLSDDLLRQAEYICELFLEGEQLLFSPAVFSFHALLAYERAIKNTKSTQLDSLQSIINRILAAA